MKLFASRAEKELLKIIDEININLANNYKDVAHDARKRLGSRADELFAEGKLSEKEHLHYRRVYEEYTEKMKNYHH